MKQLQIAIILLLLSCAYPLMAQNTQAPSSTKWQMSPTASGSTSVKMAAPASTHRGVAYYFECISGGGHDSGWQSSSIYEDTGLTAGKSYTYRFKMRDASSSQKKAAWSASASASPANAQAGGFTYEWANYDSSNPSEFGPLNYTDDFTGVRSISHAPAVGVHPRVFFGPSDIPDIQNRLANTASGQAVAAQIHAYTTLLHLGYNNGGTYNHNSSYGSDGFGSRYIDNAGAWDFSSYYAKLVAQDPTVWDGIPIKTRHRTASLMALEAFECLMYAGQTDGDTGLSYSARTADLTTAMTFWASLVIGNPDNNSSNFNFCGGEHMALCYDLNYNNMTTAQQDLVRQAIAEAIPTLPRHGGYVAPYANTSNWAGLNSFEILMNLAIEGETGYQTLMTERWMRMMHNFITYGWYDSGAGYEGLGKNYQFVTTLVACAQRGYSLLGHPHVRALGDSFLPAIMQPYGYGFTSYDVWGGSGYDDETGGYKFNSADAVGLKWAFPNDPSIDFVWQNYIEKWYGNSSQGYVYQQIVPDDSYNNYLIPAAVFASDYQTGNWSTRNQTALKNSTDFLAPDRGLAIMRSSFDTDAMSVQFHCRQDMGGHTHGDRLDFTLSALDRIWVRKTYGGSQFQPSYFHSTVLIDDKGVGVGDPDGDKCRQPGKLLSWQPTSNFSTVAGDATYAYTWEWHWSPQNAGSDHPWLGSNSWEKVLETWNDFKYIPGNETYHNTPFYDYDHWTSAGKLERMVKRPYNPMQRVFRTVGLVKGTYPFTLVVDDVQKDNSVHNYKWVAQVARDLTIESTDVNLNDADYRCDVILEELAATGNRRLLVRILNNENYNSVDPPAILEDLVYLDYFNGNPYNSNPNISRPRLVAESNSVTPNFKVLLYPHYSGDPLPQTVWNAAHDTLMVSINGENNGFAFELLGNGQTIIHQLSPTPYHNLEITAFLEGAFNSGTQTMSTNLLTNNLLALSQPYAVAPYNYTGTEAVSNHTNFPLHTVDWVLVEIRDGANPNMLVEQRVALLQNDGSIIDAATLTNGVRLYNLTTGNNYHAILRHRNHLDVMSANTIIAANSMTYDFTNANQILGGQQQVQNMGTVNALFAADMNGSGIISVADFNEYQLQLSATGQYIKEDVNLDGTVSISDYNLYRPNASKIGVQMVRY